MKPFYSLAMFFYRKTWLGNRFFSFYFFLFDRIIPEKIQIKKKYKKVFGKYPNLKKPKTLNEKIQWLKLYDRSDLHTICADKYAVREYIEETIGKKYLIPLLFHTTDPKNINSQNIPDIPVVIKTNHDSNGVIFVRNKTHVNWHEIQENLSKRLKSNYYWKSKEWQYKNITPRILVEELLEDEDGEIPFDYKVHCFNSKAIMIQVDMGRGSEAHYRNWYSTDWKREPYKWSSTKGNGKTTDPSLYDVDEPKNLSLMIYLSEKLARSFKYVRVDWYDHKEKLYFGELTFHHDGGYRPIEPSEWDLKLGSKLELPIDD